MSRHRTLAVQIEGLAIEDGEIPLPKIGMVLDFPLHFTELPAEHIDAVTIRAVLIADGHPPIFQYTGKDSPRRWEWSGVLRGDGWEASWRGFHPRSGHVELTGRFYGTLSHQITSRVRGRVTRVQLISMRYRREPDTHGWVIVPGHRSLREVTESPRFFDTDVFMRDDVDEVDHESGAWIELDLDDVPPHPVRPRFVPGDVSAAGDVLWTVDSGLPLVVSIGSDHVATEHVLPGPTGVSRSVWATPEGCWVAGIDGTYRCARGFDPCRINDVPVHAGAVVGEILLACSPGGQWWLHTPGADPIAVKAPDEYVNSIAVEGDSFLVLLEKRVSDRESSRRLMRVTTAGDVTTGPVLSSIPGPRRQRLFLAGSPLRLFNHGTASTILPDLSLGGEYNLGWEPFHVKQVGTYVCTVAHPSSDASPIGQRPGDRDPTRRYRLLTLLDAATLEPVKSAPIFAIRPAITVDATGTVWIVADGVQSLPEQSMQWPNPLDVAALLDYP